MVTVNQPDKVYEWINERLDPNKHIFCEIKIKIVDGSIVHVEEIRSINLNIFNNVTVSH